MPCVDRPVTGSAVGSIFGLALPLSIGLSLAGCSGALQQEAVSAVSAVSPTALPTALSTVLAAPRPSHTAIGLRQQAAERIVAANPSITYLGNVPETLLAIPVLEIELDRDGGVRRIVVLRWPRQAIDTVQIAKAAVYRAAPFGDVSRLPRPWKFVETFLFDEARRFKPRTLDR